jgi:hypothetical protein
MTMEREWADGLAGGDCVDLLCRAGTSGSVAGLAAAAIAGESARALGATRAAPMNAVTHCLWPRTAPRETRVSARHTLLGLAIHQGAAIFWALLFERIAPRAPRDRPVATCAAAAVTAATAYVVDYHVVPRRFTPGFEAHLPPRALARVYVAIAAGLAVAAFARRAQR